MHRGFAAVSAAGEPLLHPTAAAGTAHHPAAGAGADAAELEALRARLLEHLLPHLRSYVWQRDRFALQPSTEWQAPWQRRGAGKRGASAAAAMPLPPHLWGSVCFGDNVEDEWFVVWLLLEATRALPVTARCVDAAAVLLAACRQPPERSRPWSRRFLRCPPTSRLPPSRLHLPRPAACGTTTASSC